MKENQSKMAVVAKFQLKSLQDNEEVLKKSILENFNTNNNISEQDRALLKTTLQAIKSNEAYWKSQLDKSDNEYEELAKTEITDQYVDNYVMRLLNNK